MSKLIDLTGKTFGNLIVLKQDKSYSGKTYWICKCQACGKEKSIQGGHLRDGVTTSCGCKNPILNSNKIGKIRKLICPICEKEFETDNANRKYCYECSLPSNEYSSSEKVSIQRKAIKEKLIKYKGGKCEKCGYNKCNRALEFHHLDPSQKDFQFSRQLIRNLDKLINEVDKCIMVCANCHREIHDELDNLK